MVASCTLQGLDGLQRFNWQTSSALNARHVLVVRIECRLDAEASGVELFRTRQNDLVISHDFFDHAEHGLLQRQLAAIGFQFPLPDLVPTSHGAQILKIPHDRSIKVGPTSKFSEEAIGVIGESAANPSSTSTRASRAMRLTLAGLYIETKP